MLESEFSGEAEEVYTEEESEEAWSRIGLFRNLTNPLERGE